MSNKKRIDILLVEKGLASSRELAKKMIIEGIVKVKEQRVFKPSEKYSSDVNITVTPRHGKFVSRGGDKLDFVLKKFEISVKNSVCLDVGISTGGFTDCLLQNGAGKVIGIDVGYGQLAWKLRNDKRVILFERSNIRYFEPKKIEDNIDVTVIDVSFISLKKVIVPVARLLRNKTLVIALVKPQFEVGKEFVGKKGIVKDPELHKKTLSSIENFIVSKNFEIFGSCPSPITGTKGNKEFFILFKT